MPHILVLFALFAYIAAGAAVFRAIEAQAEIGQIDRKVQQLRTEYENLVQKKAELCQASDFETFDAKMTASLKQISILHENNYAPVESADIVSFAPVRHNPRWSYASAVLYALGVITTSGTISFSRFSLKYE